MLVVDTRHVKAKFLASVETVKTDKFLAKRFNRNYKRSNCAIKVTIYL